MNTTLPKPDTTRPAVAPATCAAVLWLMTHYARRPCPLIAHVIADQLERLAQACDDRIAPALLPQWQRIACGNTGTRPH